MINLEKLAEEFKGFPIESISVSPGEKWSPEKDAVILRSHNGVIGIIWNGAVTKEQLVEAQNILDAHDSTATDQQVLSDVGFSQALTCAMVNIVNALYNKATPDKWAEDELAKAVKLLPKIKPKPMGKV